MEGEFASVRTAIPLGRPGPLARLLGFAVLTVTLIGCGTSTVHVGVGAASPTPVSAADVSAAKAVLALAHGSETAQVRWAEHVTYSLSGHEVGTVRPGPSLARSLRACPFGATEYEGRTCPVSPLATLAAAVRAGWVIAIERGRPETVGCSTSSAPSGATGLTAVSLRPPKEKRDCFSDFAVTIYVNEQHQVAWIDFVLSGP